MITLHPEYVVDEQQHRKAVLLPVEEWEQIMSDLDDLDDIRAYDAAREQSGDKLLFEQAVREIQQDYEA
jgi:PHD/YefM family antitoxin component YafN of YafNO toxin-antitoxin module